MAIHMSSVSVLKNLTEEELKELLIKASQDPVVADRFFNSFIYVNELQTGNALNARTLGMELLSICNRLDPEAYKKINKGTPYYWLGTAACILEDYESAVFFYDAAATEDLKNGASP